MLTESSKNSLAISAHAQYNFGHKLINADTDCRDVAYLSNLLAGALWDT